MKTRKPKLDWIEEVLGNHGQDAIKRRAGLAGNIGKAHEARSRAVLALENLDGTILQFEPDQGGTARKNWAPGKFRGSAQGGVVTPEHERGRR